MDSFLTDMLKESAGEVMLDTPKTLELMMELVDGGTGEIAIIRDGRRETYRLKTLAELYGSGNLVSADPQNDTFMPLFLGIEEEIARYDATRQRLTDADVGLALNALSLKPEVVSEDPLVVQIQFAVRLILSLNNYSRQEIRQAFRKIGRSVERHNEGGRGRGYLNFIQKYFGRR